MEFKKLVLGMVACATLAACSQDEFADNNVGNKLEGEAYVSVDIFAPNGNTSRAVSDIDFEAGKDEENSVTKATFLFFDGAGNSCAAPVEKTDLKWENGTGSIAKISIPVLVLDPINGTIPTSMIAVLNSTESFTGKSLSEVKALIGKSEAYKSGFIMSNSVYALNGSTVAEVALSALNVSTDKEVAKKNPVQIPVERVVAKVAVTGLSTTSEPQTITIDNKEVTVKAVIKGWKATATNPDSYLVKQINPAWDFVWNGVGSWTNPANFRSYWAASATPAAYNYYSYTQAIANTTEGGFEYCLENAGVADNGAPVATNTMLLAVAQLQNAETGAPVSFMQWKGFKYGVDGMKIHMANMLNKYYYKVAENKYATITKDHLEFGKATNQYQVLATLREGVAFFCLNEDGTINSTDKTAELTAEIKAFGPISYWKDGMTYYFTAINHDAGQNQVVVPGIVRNHVYKMTINSITGLGTPIPDEEEVIIPTKPDKDDSSYLAAQVQVLKWKIVSQSVNFD